MKTISACLPCNVAIFTFQCKTQIGYDFKIHIFNNKISPYIHQIELCELGLQSNTFTNKWEKRLTESFQKNSHGTVVILTVKK